jgi:hypothetical protein
MFTAFRKLVLKVMFVVLFTKLYKTVRLVSRGIWNTGIFLPKHTVIRPRRSNLCSHCCENVAFYIIITSVW